MDEIYLGNWSPAKNPGETPSLEEVRNNAYSAAQTYQNANSWQRQEEEEIDRLNDSIQKAGGKPLSNPWRVAPSADDYAAIRDQTIRDGRPVMVNKWLHDKYERDLLALRDQHPDLISPETVPSFVVSKRMKDAEAKTADISTRRGWTDPKQLPVVGSVPLVREFTGAAVDTIRDPAGMANQFAGGLAGIWNSPADIVANLLPFGAGSASKSIIKNAVINAIGNAGGQAALEPSVQANRAKGGLEYGIGPALEDIAGAAATGAVLDVGVRAPVRAFNRAVDPKMRIGEARNPDTQFGGVLTDAPAKSTLPEPPRPAPTIDPETFKAAEAGDVPALRKLAEQTRAIEDPSVKAMVEHLELTGSVDEAVKRFRDEMQSRTGTAIDDGDLQRTVAGHLRAAIDPDVLPPRREPAAVRPAAEPLMDAEAAKILTDHAPQVSQIVQGLEPRIAAMVSDGLEAGLAPIVRAVQQAIDAGPEGQPQTIANLGNAISKAADAMGGMETFADHITLHSGRSSIMEVATAMRRSPEVVDSNVSFGTEMMQVARALAMLDDAAFNIMARGEADPRIGQMVADTVEPGRQAGVLDQVARAGVRDLDEARRLIADLEPRRIPEPVRDGVDDPNSPETKAATERMEQSMAPEVEMARKAVPEPQPGQSMVDAIMQSAVVRRGAETREAIVDAIRLASKILPEGTRLEIENAEMRDPRTGGLLDAQTASNGDIILAAYAMNPAGRIGHEGVHTLVARGLLSPDEVKLLAEAAGKTEIKAEGAKEGDAPQTVFPAERRAQYAEAYADRPNLDQLLDEEAAAHLIEAVVNKKAIPEDAPRTIIERIQKMLEVIAERLKNWRDGKGWQTAEDLINDILNGEVAKREGVKAWMRGEDISALAVKRPDDAMYSLAGVRSGLKPIDPDQVTLRRRRVVPALKIAAAETINLAQDTLEHGLATARGLKQQQRAMDGFGPDSTVAFYDIYVSGRKFGDAVITVSGDTATVEWIGDQTQTARGGQIAYKSSATLGRKAVLKMYEQFRNDFPNVKNFIGKRVSGSRVGDAAPWNNDVRQSVMFALSDRDTGQSMRRDMDALGFFSKLDEVLSSFGPKDRVTAQTLQSKGVKAGEIEARGLAGLLKDGAAAVGDLQVAAKANPVELREVMRETLEAYNEKMAAREARGDSVFKVDGEPDTEYTGAPKWSAYSLDPSNPSYRETVLHLPETERPPTFDEFKQTTGLSDAVARKVYDSHMADWPRSRQNFGVKSPSFNSGHFPEPNIVGHMMTSMTKHEGRPVYTVDQIQSDWGQKLRDQGGPPSPERDAEIRASIDEKKRALAALPQLPEWFRSNGSIDRVHIENVLAPFKAGKLLNRSGLPQDLWDSLRIAVQRGDGDWSGSLQQMLEASRFDLVTHEGAAKIRAFIAGNQAIQQALKPLEDARSVYSRRRLLEAELRTLENNDRSTTGHPLVNTTDQWVNTTLRRALRQAAEADAAYIAIPHGDTVLSYNPGDEAGMRGFYGSRSSEGIVPKNLRKLLEKLDKDSAKPVKVEKLETPSGPRGYRPDAKGKFDKAETGFTLFPLSDKVKAEVTQRGQAMFAFAGEKARTADLDALARAQQMTADGIDRDTIWKETGWGRFADKRWRFELDDSKARINFKNKWDFTAEGAFDEILTNPSLFEAYPHLKGISARFETMFESGYFEPDASKTGPRIYAANLDSKLLSSIAMHEAQHGIQHAEGFSTGGNITSRDSDPTARSALEAAKAQRVATDKLLEAWMLAPREEKDAAWAAYQAGKQAEADAKTKAAEIVGSTPDPMTYYKRIAGEVEARAVQTRMRMSPEERRSRPPWYDFDVPEEQQIVRFANGTGLSMFAFSEEAPVDGFSMRGLRMYAIRAFHGSPHDFDKFDLSKIGTGEGAQAYGHGLYFAENEGVARSYRDKLKKTTVNGAPYSSKNPEGVLAQAKVFTGGDEDAARKYLQTNIDFSGHPQELRNIHQQALDLLNENGFPAVRQDPGKMYEVNIHADPNDFLDWDRPLSQQSDKVQAFAAKELAGFGQPGRDPMGMTGGEFYRGLDDAPAQLRKAGTPGIRYLDQGSRTAGEGSRNYVVFDDALIEIVAKDGVPVTKQERAEIIGRMQPEQKAEPQSPFPADLQAADRLKDAGEAIKVKPDDGAMYALADPKSVIDELERKSTLGKSEADEIRKKLDHLKAAGMSDDAALDAVAAELEGISEDKKRVALLGEKARQTLIGDLVKYRNHRGETDVLEAWKRLHERFDTTGAYIEDLETARLAIQERTLARMGGLLKEFKRGALTGDMRRKTGRTYAKQQNMVRELFGESTGDQTAKELATAVGAMFEDLRLRFNKAGGHIGKLEKWGMPQGHDAQALRDYGMQKWVDYMMQDGVLDRDRMVSQHTGRKLTDGELRDALTVTWQRITTDGWVDREITGQPMGRGALFNQHSDHRFLHFKTADAWLRYAKDFGNPDPYAAIMNHVARMSRDIAHMERLGPNPQMMRTYIRNWMTQKAASAGSVESLIREQQGKMAQLAKDHAEELKDLLKGRQELLDELAERYLDMERVKMRSAIKRGLGMKEEQAKRLADLDARTRVIDNLLYNRTQQRDLLTMRHAMVREQIADMMRAMREAVEISSDKDPQAALNNTLNRVDAMWEVQRGALVPVSTKMANVLAIGRNIISADALGSAVISSITDPAYGQEARKRWGESFARSNAGTVMAQTLKQMFKPGARWEALDSGIAMDSAMSVFHSQAKQNKSWLPWMRDMSGYINDRVLSLGLLTPWTEAGKAAHGTWLQLYLGRNAHLPFDKLAPDIQKGLTANGFDAASWEQIRMSRLYDPKTHGPATRDSQAKQLRPKEIEAAAGQDLAERYIAMIARETRHGIIETTVESRAAIIGTTRPGTVSGEIVRSAGQFKGFPLAVVFIVLGRLAREIGAGDYKSAARHAASLAITSAFLGFAAMALKDIKDGRDPRRLLDEKTWMAFDTWAAAILQAGGLGIWGDFMFSNVNRQGNGLAATLGGPMVDRIDNIKNLTIGNLFQIYQGKETQAGRESVRFLRQNVPGVSSWFFTSMAWNRIFMDELQRMVDPKAHEQFRAQIMNRRRDYGGQEYWWKPGQTRPERAPDLTRPFATH